MNGHPGGEEHTLKMLLLSGLPVGASVLDMGAGAGETVRLLRRRGYDACGIDLEPRSGDVIKGNFLRTDFADGVFDGILSQCSFYVSGYPRTAVREAGRLLKTGGVLMLSDVFFDEPELSGFEVLFQEDMTPAWRDYYLEALWREERPCCSIPSGKHCSYLMLLARKKENGYGSY